MSFLTFVNTPHRMRLAFIFLIFCNLFLTGCAQINYLYEAGLNQFRILNSREKISVLLTQKNLEPELKEKLELIVASRKFAKAIGFKVAGTYESVAQLKDEKTIWVLLANKKNRFKLYQWNYPIVGKTPYKGFFDKKSALHEAKFLSSKNYDTSLRTTVAFSSLGWFDDPILPSMLKLSKTELTNTIFHELIHKELWIKDQVAFNESLANFLAHEINIKFYEALLKTNLERAANATKTLELQKLYLDSLNARTRPPKLARKLRAARRDLIYKNSANLSLTREQILQTHQLPITLSNADILQQKIYHSGIPRIKRCYKAYGGSIKLFAFINDQAKVGDTNLFKSFLACGR